MNNEQRIITAIYLTLTLLILFFTTLYELENPALYLKFGVRIAMLLSVIFIKKHYNEQKILVLAFLCTVVSDYFFVLLAATNPDFINRELYGMLGFIMAYLFLIAAFQRNFRFGKKEIVTLIPFIIIFGMVLAVLKKYIAGLMLWAAIVLGVVLCYTGMTVVTSLFRGYFSKKAAWQIAIAGCILFCSDMVVAFSIFHPVYKGFLLWKENFIWGTYMIGWMLLLNVAVEARLVVQER